MLEKVLTYIHNWFETERHSGTFTVSGGVLSDINYLKDGQYYRIKGSVFNNGLHVWNSEETLTDETFNGQVWAMAIPPVILQIVSEMEEWAEKHKNELDSPYQSESFGGYSYSRGSSYNVESDGNGDAAVFNHFAATLRPWRKLNDLD